MHRVYHFSEISSIHRKKKILAFAKKCKLNTLLFMLSTIHRRHILTYLEKEKSVSLRKLKASFVDTHEMNQTTLYRILERFLLE